MTAVLKTIRLLLPLALAAAAGALRFRAGGGGFALVLVVAGGGLLGWALALLLESVLVLVGLTQSRLTHEPLALEREKETLLRSIKDIELDASLLKLDPEEAKHLTEPLRQRAALLLRDLDRARAQRRSVDQQIEEELQRRLAASEEGAR